MPRAATPSRGSSRVPGWIFGIGGAAVLHLAIPVAAKVAPDTRVGWFDASELWMPPADVDIEPPQPNAPLPPPLQDPQAHEEETRPTSVDPRTARVDAPPPAVALQTGRPLPLVPTAPGVTAPGPDTTSLPPDPNAALTGTDGNGNSEFSTPAGPVPYSDGGMGFGPYTGGGWPLLVDNPGGRGPAAPTAAPRRGEIPANIGAKVIDNRLADRDRDLGMELPAAGRVQGIVESVARAAVLEEEFAGAFAVSLGPSGEFQGIQLLSSSGGSSGDWAKVVNIAKSQLGAQKFAMRSAYEKGAIITITVRAQVRDVSGAKSTFSNFDITSAVTGPVRVVSSYSSVQPIR